VRDDGVNGIGVEGFDNKNELGAGGFGISSNMSESGGVEGGPARFLVVSFSGIDMALVIKVGGKDG